MLDCKEYSLLVKEDVQILHKGLFYKALFANGCYGLYKLKCLKFQFPLWKI